MKASEQYLLILLRLKRCESVADITLHRFIEFRYLSSNRLQNFDVSLDNMPSLDAMCEKLLQSHDIANINFLVQISRE